jgi:hypothetical protein
LFLLHFGSVPCIFRRLFISFFNAYFLLTSLHFILSFCFYKYLTNIFLFLTLLFPWKYLSFYSLYFYSCLHHFSSFYFLSFIIFVYTYWYFFFFSFFQATLSLVVVWTFSFSCLVSLFLLFFLYLTLSITWWFIRFNSFLSKYIYFWLNFSYLLVLVLFHSFCILFVSFNFFILIFNCYLFVI